MTRSIRELLAEYGRLHLARSTITTLELGAIRHRLDEGRQMTVEEMTRAMQKVGDERGQFRLSDEDLLGVAEIVQERVERMTDDECRVHIAAYGMDTSGTLH